MRYFQNTLKRYKIVLTHETISKFIHYAEDNDDAMYLEFEQILKNAEETDELITIPLEEKK